MRRILIATDGSPSAAEAASVGITLASEQGAEVTFVHVVTDAAALPSHDDEAAINAAAELARETGLHADVVIVSGDAVDEIVAYADTIDANMIIVGSRGRNAVTSAPLGNVSGGVLDEARRPVLVVPRTPQRRELVSNLTSQTRSEA